MKNSNKEPRKKNDEKDSDSESEFEQKQAFSIPDPEGSDVDPEEAEAFRYIMAVREQATIIKQENKNNIRENKRKMKLIEQERKAEEIKEMNQEEIGSGTNENKDGVDADVDEESEMLEEECINKGLYVVDSRPVPKWLDSWMHEARSNWLCVIENMKHLHKNSEDLKPFIKRSSSEILSKIPEINEICSLSMGRVESMLVELSDEYYANGGLYYYIWIYCLLGVHRSLSFYNIFEGIGSINSCLENEKVKTVESLIVCCLLIKEFSQNHLWKVFEKNIEAIEKIQ